MATKTHIAWSIAAVTTITAMGLAGALYRVQDTNKKQIVVIKHLRDEQTKINELGKENSTRLASDVTRLDGELRDAQNAQRELTEQLFATEEEIDYLYEMLDAAEEAVAVEVAAPSPAIDSPYPAFLALKRAVLAGEPYHAQWEAMQKHTAANNVLNAHVAGVASLETLKQELREAYASAHEVKQESTILSRLGDVISIRKLDKENDAIREIVMSGDVDKAAESLRSDSAYQNWIEAYDARKEVLDALDTLEAQLVGDNG